MRVEIIIKDFVKRKGRKGKKKDGEGKRCQKKRSRYI